MSQVLKADAQSFILSLPQGKPDTKIPLKNGAVDERPRIAQSPQTAPNCQWCAMNILRKRIGKNPGSDYTEARRIEKLCSDFYKNKTLFMRNFISQLLAEFTRTGTIRDGKKETIKTLLSILPFCIKIPDEYRSSVLSCFEEFCTQVECDDIHAYLGKKYTPAEAALCLKFLESIGPPPQQHYEQHLSIVIRDGLALAYPQMPAPLREQCILPCFSRFPTLKNLSEKEPSVLHTLCFTASSKAFGFKISSWTPSKSIDKLQERLKSEGALFVAGLYGKALYIKPPFVAEKISGRPVYSWKASDRCIFSSPSEQKDADRHCIVVMGAAQGGKKAGFVYFVDPIDGSDPQNPLQQKIYVISYENLISNLSDLRGTAYQPPRESPYGYALYYPQTP